MLTGISSKKKILFIPVHFTAFDKAQIAPLGVTKCFHMSENKIYSEISQSVWLLLKPGSFVQSEHFCRCGFVSLVWLKHIMQHRSCSQCESTFLSSACVSVCTQISACMLVAEMDLSLVFEKQFGQKPCCLWRRAILRRACTHLLFSPSLVLEPCVDSRWFITTFSQARNFERHHHYSNYPPICSAAYLRVKTSVQLAFRMFVSNLCCTHQTVGDNYLCLWCPSGSFLLLYPSNIAPLFPNFSIRSSWYTQLPSLSFKKELCTFCTLKIFNNLINLFQTTHMKLALFTALTAVSLFSLTGMLLDSTPKCCSWTPYSRCKKCF